MSLVPRSSRSHPCFPNFQLPLPRCEKSTLRLLVERTDCDIRSCLNTLQVGGRSGLGGRGMGGRLASLWEGLLALCAYVRGGKNRLGFVE